MVTLSIRWMTSGGTPEALPWALIFSTTFIPEVTWPKREYEFGSDSPSVPATMNHWLPPLFGWPVLAMATDPSGYWSAGFEAFAGSSSGMVYPGPPLPVPVGSPV